MRVEGRRVLGVPVGEDGVDGSVISEMKIGGRSLGRGCDFRARTSGVTVAVKRRVSLDDEGGSAERQVLRSGSIDPGPDARRRSASSSTTTLARFRPTVVSLPDV